MQRDRILYNELQNIKSSILKSRIQHSQYQKEYQNSFQVIRVPKIERLVVQNYRSRIKWTHQHVPSLFIQQKSPFYVTVYIEKCSPFNIKDLLMLPMIKRKTMLITILETAEFLSNIYGFFYITQKMFGYNRYGNLVLWINENIDENKRSFPINHGKLSEQIFAADFKQGFTGNLKEMREFHKAKSIKELINLLNNKQSIYTSLYINQLPWTSNIIKGNIPNMSLHQKDFLQKSFINKHYQNQAQNYKSSSEVKGQTSKKLCKRISFSYISNQVQQNQRSTLHKTLNTCVSAQNLISNRRKDFLPEQRTLLFKRNSMTYSNVPDISFIYKQMPEKIKQKENLQQKSKEKTSNQSLSQNKQSFLKKCTSNNILSFKNSSDHQKQSLKCSFPHTTTHTFTPFASNGNLTISNPYRDSFNFSHKSINLERFQQEKHHNSYDNKISEESNEIEMQLQNLFSEQQQQQQDSFQKLEQMQNIISQIQSLLF